MEEMLLQRKQIAEKKNKKVTNKVLQKTGPVYFTKSRITITYEYFRFKALSDVFSFADCSPDCSTCPDK
jgi:hypothetical protein